MSLSVGDILDDRYVLLERLGEGGQSEVWKALDRLPPNHHVALKLLALDRTSTRGLERLRREASALHKLSHPSLVPCRRAFEDLSRGIFGLVLDYVEGCSIDAVLADPQFTPAHRKWVLTHLASALWYLHERGIVHRDLKPENVLLAAHFWREPDRPESVKLIDLGIAALEGNPNPVTDVGRVIGTAPYMAPEVIDPEMFRAPVTGPTRDVFAFGVLGWRLLAGQHPTGLDDGDLQAYASAYRAALRGSTPWPAGSVPGAWGFILTRCFALRAADRPPSGREVAETVQGLGSSAHDATVPQGDLASRRGSSPPRDRASTRAETAVRHPPPSITDAAPGFMPPGSAPTVPHAPLPGAVFRAPEPAAIAPPPARRGGAGGALLYVLAGVALALGAVVLWVTFGPGGAVANPGQAPSTPLGAGSRPPDEPIPTATDRPAPAPRPRSTSEPPPKGSKTLAANAFAAACCVDTHCEWTPTADRYFSEYDARRSGAQCGCASKQMLLGCCGEPLVLPRDVLWTLRLSYVALRDPATRKETNLAHAYPDAQLCVKRSRDWNASLRCVPVADTLKSSDGVSTGLLVSTADLETNGVDIRVFERDATAAPEIFRRMHAVPSRTPLGPIAQCIGLKYGEKFEVTGPLDPAVYFFIDHSP